MTIDIVLKNGTVETFSADEFSRWACLIEAFELIENKANELKMDIDKLLKPLAIEMYIKERFPSIRHDIGIEMEMGNI